MCWMLKLSSIIVVYRIDLSDHNPKTIETPGILIPWSTNPAKIQTAASAIDQWVLRAGLVGRRNRIRHPRIFNQFIAQQLKHAISAIGVGAHHLRSSNHQNHRLLIIQTICLMENRWVQFKDFIPKNLVLLMVFVWNRLSSTSVLLNTDKNI